VRLGRYELTLEPRPAVSAVYTVLTAVVAILLALALSSFLFLSADVSLLGAYRAVFSYAFFNPRGILATVQRAIYLLFCTYAFLVPLRAGLWNIGLPARSLPGRWRRSRSPSSSARRRPRRWPWRLGSSSCSWSRPLPRRVRCWAASPASSAPGSR